jgi:hypothetical protein
MLRVARASVMCLRGGVVGGKVKVEKAASSSEGGNI